MVLILMALSVGLALGLLTRGSMRNLSRVRFRWWGLTFLAVVLQFAPVPDLAGDLESALSVAMLIASYLAVMAFVVANLRVAGMPVIAAGFALNVVVIALNGSMPVADDALRKAYEPELYRQHRRELTSGEEMKHHLAEDDDVALALGDVIPVPPPVSQVISIGDLVWMGGTVWLAAALTKEPASGGRGAASRKDEGFTPRRDADEEEESLP